MILKFYKPKQILFVDIQPASAYITKEKKIADFATTEQQKKSIELKKQLISDCAHQFIKDVKPNVIKVPQNVLGNEMHKWGKSPFHYQQELYDYLLSAYTVIMRRLPFKKIRLALLYKRYNRIFEKTRKNCKVGSIP